MSGVAVVDADRATVDDVATEVVGCCVVVDDTDAERVVRGDLDSDAD